MKIDNCDKKSLMDEAGAGEKRVEVRVDTSTEGSLGSSGQTGVKDGEIATSRIIPESKEANGKEKKKKIPVEYSSAIEVLILKNRKLVPRDAKRLIIENLKLDPNNLPSDFPSEKAIKISPEPLLPRPPTIPTPKGILCATRFN